MKLNKVKLIDLNNSQYDVNQYIASGFYLVEDTGELLIVCKSIFLVQFITSGTQAENVIRELKLDITQSKGTISEEFALKMLAVANGNVEKIKL